MQLIIFTGIFSLNRRGELVQLQGLFPMLGCDPTGDVWLNAFPCFQNIAIYLADQLLCVGRSPFQMTLF